MPLEELLIILMTFGVGSWLLNPIVKALAERLRGGHATEAQLQSWRDDIVAELRDVRREIGEVSERVDFAERLLAQRGAVDALPPRQER